MSFKGKTADCPGGIPGGGDDANDEKDDDDALLVLLFVEAMSPPLPRYEMELSSAGELLLCLGVVASDACDDDNTQQP